MFISSGTLYPILHKLEKDRLVKSHTVNHEGKIRKYYETTTKGHQTLEQAKEKINLLINEIMG
jgi:DNA-binding PadR family transcriptional regulator